MMHGLECDNPECDYKDESIQFEDYEKYINFPCPKCGAPLLTQEDYDAAVFLVKLENSPTVKKLAKLYPKDKVRIKLHGHGFKDVTITKVED